MDKVKNQLYLNYLRKIGKPFSVTPGGWTNAISVQSAYVRVFPEFLVPDASDTDHNTITALANAVYSEARIHNMSLSPFGRLDPVKFVLASVFIPLLLAEIKRDLSVVGVYQFDNTAYGTMLARACRFNFSDAMTNLGNYCKEFNVVAAKANSLYVPISGLVQRWIDHRVTIYKDDEGERYQFYLYNMGNYYELDTNANSATLGQLVFKPLDHSIQTIAQKLNRVSNLIDNYLNDDDFCNFCTEAVQAKMSRLVVDPIEGTEDNWQLPKCKFSYSLDDIMSLENARFITPMVSRVALFGSLNTHWNIYEDVISNRLVVGMINGVGGVGLPCLGVTSSSFSPAITTLFNKSIALTNGSKISDVPIITHSKITSLQGLSNLTRYICGYGAQLTTSVAGVNVIVMENGISKIASSLSIGDKVIPVTVHSTELLGGMLSYFSYNGVIYEEESQRKGVFLGVNSTVAAEMKANLAEDNRAVGFKARFVTFVLDSDNSLLYNKLGDYDYITYVADDTLATFFACNAWNDVQLVSGYSAGKDNTNK